MDAEDRVVTLIDEDGEPFEFVVIDLFVVEEQEYAIMVPLQGDDLETEDEEDYLEDDEADEDDESFFNLEENLEEEEAVIIRLYRNEDGETSFELIDDEAEWEKVSAVAFERLYQVEEEEE